MAIADQPAPRASVGLPSSTRCAWRVSPTRTAFWTMKQVSVAVWGSNNVFSDHSGIKVEIAEVPGKLPHLGELSCVIL